MEYYDLEKAEVLIDGTEAGKIWDEIKGLDLKLFALDNQFVYVHSKPILVDEKALYLKTSVSALLPSLEELLRDKFTVERVDQYIVVTRK